MIVQRGDSWKAGVRRVILRQHLREGLTRLTPFQGIGPECAVVGVSSIITRTGY